MEALVRMNQQLAQLEATPFRPGDPAPVAVTIDGVREEHTYDEWRVLARDAKSDVCRLLMAERSEEEGEQLLMIERQELALIYRSNLPDGFSGDPENLKRDLAEIITRYKQRPPAKGNPSLYPGRENEPLSIFDHNQINHLCDNYPRFAEALIRRNPAGTTDDDLTEGFIKFCLRSCGASGKPALHWVGIFVKYPNEVEQLMRATLDKRLGATDPDLLQVRQREDGSYALFMKIDNVFQEVLGEKSGKRVSLKNRVQIGAPAYETTVKEIYKQIAAKRAGYFNFEVFQEGVINWEALKLGSYNPGSRDHNVIDVTQPNWLYNAIPIWKTLTEDQVRARYENRVNFNWDNVPHEHRFAMAVCATRLRTNKDIADNHGYIELILPEVGQPGLFRIILISVQPFEFPDGKWEKLVRIEATLECMLHIIDESAYLSNRQFYGEAYSLTPDEYQALQEHLAHFVAKARQGKEVFQPMGHNCARHAQKFYDKSIGSKFYKPFEALAARVAGEGYQSLSHETVKKITKGLSDEALTTMANDVAEGVVKQGNEGEIGNLIMMCFQALSTSAANPGQQLGISHAEAMEQVRVLLESDLANGRIRLKNDLATLIKLAFESQQLYSMSLLDISSETLDPLINLLKAISWEPLRNVVLRFVQFILGSWRGHSYEKQDGTKKTMRAWNHDYHATKIQLPARAFDRPERVTGLREATVAMFRNYNSPVPVRV